MEKKLAVGITTKNRLESLLRCLGSLVPLKPLLTEVIVVDGESSPRLEDPVKALCEKLGLPLKYVYLSPDPGHVVSRNRIARETDAPLMLILDDDTDLFDVDAVHEAIRVLETDPRVGVIAFAQADKDGRSFSEYNPKTQPAPVTYPCFVPSYIGFAALFRRDTFMKVGGYHDILCYWGEEKELCLRLIDAGHSIIYLPQAMIKHLLDPVNRDRKRYLRNLIRSECLTVLINFPLWLVPPSLVWKFHTYGKVKKGSGVKDPTSLLWLCRELFRNLGAIFSLRKAVRWSTLRRWKQIRAEWPRYERPAISDSPRRRVG